ncbi:iron-containing alcohol dehydrogenase [Paraburkholderia sp. A2WS-5]|uniref:iron-containing alcohol dehydrogenase n=1 Tax=unclassified Paraburkholderia TaxID=2615204 RepID=UPI003B77393E
MPPFSFRTAQSIVVEHGASRRLASQVRSLGSRSVLIVTDACVASSGFLKSVLDGFESAAIRYQLFQETQADPSESIIEAAVCRALAAEADCVVGLGSGGSLDTAKLTALLAKSGERLADVYGIDRARGPRLPLILVPTTAGTGSLAARVSVVTKPRGDRNVVVSSHLLPDLALLDATLTAGAPPAVTAAGGIDAMVNAIEAFTSRRLKNPVSDSLACKALDLMASNLHAAFYNPTDIEAREQMLIGACLAEMAVANVAMAAVHALAQPVAARFRVPHGIAHALLLAPVLRFNLKGAVSHYAQLARYVLPGITGTAASRASSFVTYFSDLPRTLRLPMRLQEVGIGESDLCGLAGDAMSQTRLLANNPCELTLKDIHGIYRSIF